MASEKEKAKSKEFDESEAIYICPKCGNTKRFIEEGRTRVREEVDFMKGEDGRIYALTGNTEVDVFDPDSVTCAECGAQVE